MKRETCFSFREFSIKKKPTENTNTQQQQNAQEKKIRTAAFC